MRNAMTAILKVTALALLALALVAFISACGSSSGGDEHTDDPTDNGDGGDPVHVSLNEWSITPAHGVGFEAEAGEMVFEIHNDGAAPHDLKVIKTDLAPDALPITDGVVDQEAAGEVIGGVDPIPSGDIYVEPYNLDAGNYVIICTIPGHYQQGMSAELTVH